MSLAAQAGSLMPQPARVIAGQGKLAITPKFLAGLTGCQDPILRHAESRLMHGLHQKTGVHFLPGIGGVPWPAALIIECQGPGEDESYRLEVTSSQARLTAQTPVGVLRGLETFLQLVEKDGVPAVQIEDRPRFRWRGLLIDVCRHWMPMEVIKRNLDGMAAVKLNVLHWHLSDDQGFRVESKKFPKLHEMGSDGRYYTQEQVREVIGYARDRGIRVVPEFDMPGHSTSWFIGYPELASAPGPYEIERRWGIFDPAMDPTREEVYQFLDGFIGEMARLFPDESFHIGGDEVNGKQWDANPRIQAFKRENRMNDNHDLQACFNRRVLEIVKKHGKKMVGWDEVLHPDLPRDIVVQSWRGPKSLAEAARLGFMGILSSGYYLDHMRPASFHYLVDPMEGQSEREARVLGGEACMWAEYVTPENIDSRIWPRAAAIAERLWSPTEVRDVVDMYRRLEVLSRDLERLGLTHRSSYLPMLERLSGGAPVEPLKTLAGVLEPVKEYARGLARPYTSQTPLNRLVDAVRPESDTARIFAGRKQLTLWRNSMADLLPIIQRSVLLKEAEPLARDVAALSAAGLEALDYIESGKRPPESWVREKTALLERAKEPRAELLIVIVEPVRKLVERAGRE